MLKFELPIVRLLMTCQRITFILFLVKNDSDCRHIDDPLVEAFAYQNISLLICLTRARAEEIEIG